MSSWIKKKNPTTGCLQKPHQKHRYKKVGVTSGLPVRQTPSGASRDISGCHRSSPRHPLLRPLFHWRPREWPGDQGEPACSDRSSALPLPVSWQWSAGRTRGELHSEGRSASRAPGATLWATFLGGGRPAPPVPTSRPLGFLSSQRPLSFSQQGDMSS